MLPSKFTGASTAESAILQYSAMTPQLPTLLSSLSETQEMKYMYLLQEFHTRHESELERLIDFANRAHYVLEV